MERQQAAFVDEKYYQVVPSGSISERVLLLARDRIYSDFLRHMRPAAGDRIIDVGVSDVVSGGANALERLYPHPQNITAVGLDEGQDFVAAFPRVAYRRVEPH